MAREVRRHRAHLPGQGGRGCRAAARRTHARSHRLGGGNAERSECRGDPGAAAPLRDRRSERLGAGVTRRRLHGGEPAANRVGRRHASSARGVHGSAGSFAFQCKSAAEAASRLTTV